MRHFWLSLALMTGVASATSWLAFRAADEPAVRHAAQQRDALEWLREDFKLTDSQFAAIRRLHETYSSECEGHCQAIQQAQDVRDALRQSGSVDAQGLAAAEARVRALREICETAIASHCRRVAAEMSPAQSQRYLARVLPLIADFDHRAAPDVGLNPHRH